MHILALVILAHWSNGLLADSVGHLDVADRVACVDLAWLLWCAPVFTVVSLTALSIDTELWWWWTRWGTWSAGDSACGGVSCSHNGFSVSWWNVCSCSAFDLDALWSVAAFSLDD